MIPNCVFHIDFWLGTSGMYTQTQFFDLRYKQIVEIRNCNAVELWTCACASEWVYKINLKQIKNTDSEKDRDLQGNNPVSGYSS